MKSRRIILIQTKRRADECFTLWSSKIEPYFSMTSSSVILGPSSIVRRLTKNGK